ncbi:MULTISPECIES: hypothetical protein [Sulfitobacter]|uniref:Uncharacterized protein n=1 Tax=Sulfitobacter profundi TaxID=2679961 RepID=A0ABW1YUR7_9RHOB|nr:MULTISPECIES: hypothetical protein [Sulfitobacter]MDF3383404.1 hypothetical protein [Sulfitobacter sp. Ks11]MDF3386822.1 hypothetical protein [Sulfitobacter sp. M85]MDF3390242.1 hypothetical protein [Sulfitobacter sp. Ks16]MDF3400879.1 hypothetical protein [Sulfitobacter sp. KE39]MDF3404300.1 hypothetical protein [Sulfitobacter sp. Ks35]
MVQVASKILGTVNAPYDADLSACQLAAAISDIEVAQFVMGPAFSFFSEVSPHLQTSFVSELELPYDKVQVVAKHFQTLCPFPLALVA